MSGRARYGLLGDPVDHSLSPRLYRAAFQYLRTPAVYEAHRVRSGDRAGLRRWMRDLAVSGGGNVTVPHKQAAANQLEVRLDDVRRTGACNCFWLAPDGRLIGDNTDVGGFRSAVRELEGMRLEGASVLLLGAGGAARAVAAVCADAGVGRLTVCNRSVSRAESLVSEMRLGDLASVCQVPDDVGTPHDLVVNATTLGLRPGDPLPLSLARGRVRYAFDLVYGPGGTAWTRHARAMGVAAIDGTVMLIDQAVLSLERWLGRLPDRDGVARAMRAEVTPGTGGDNR